MREIVQNPQEARRRGLAGKALVEERFSCAAVGARYLSRLQEIASRSEVQAPTESPQAR